MRLIDSVNFGVFAYTTSKCNSIVGGGQVNSFFSLALDRFERNIYELSKQTISIQAPANVDNPSYFLKSDELSNCYKRSSVDEKCGDKSSYSDYLNQKQNSCL